MFLYAYRFIKDGIQNWNGGRNRRQKQNLQCLFWKQKLNDGILELEIIFKKEEELNNKMRLKWGKQNT